MQFDYRYAGSSTATTTPNATGLSFAPDTLRKPTHFVGTLRQHLPFREAISALHDVVVSDLRFKPKDRTEYEAWLAQQEAAFLADAMARHGDVSARITDVRAELTALWNTERSVMKPFWDARQRFFKYTYKKYRDLWFVLDPVITVHPDEVFFECFSQDESSYGRLSCSHEVFDTIDDVAYGTTNVDYSAALYDAFQKIRTYKTTEFAIDPSGFEVQTEHEDTYKEVKIDLPDSWVRGFLQVSSAMTLPARRVDLHPMDVHNLLFVLKRRKEREGPRSMRYHLTPGAPVRVVFEPWNIEVVCPRSIYRGDEPDEIRVWGRRRLTILERLIPVARAFSIFLLGTGLPSFYLADLGDLTFTLGLSGWTANDWSRQGQFDLMAPRADVDAATKQQVFRALAETWHEAPESLARRTGLDRSTVLAALGAYTQAGRAIYDLNKGVYRVRELSREPLPLDRLRFASEREQEADRLVAEGAVEVTAEPQRDGRLVLSGTVRDGTQTFAPTLTIDADERIVAGSCSCHYYVSNKLMKGPCVHMLALRRAHAQRSRFVGRLN
ncbi:MAG: SWIM zinc finger family protein [Bacteroidota bacterium]